MDNTRAISYKTDLKDRTLWFDGDSSFKGNNIVHLMSKYDIKYVDELNDMIREYNKHVSKDREIKKKDHCDPIEVKWTVGNVKRDLELCILDIHEARMASRKVPVSDQEMVLREKRLVEELIKYKKRGLFDVLRTIIWIINKLYANGVVWGVGRGSSVSSYVLYAIGVHDVDSYAFGLSIDDFLHD